MRCVAHATLCPLSKHTEDVQEDIRVYLFGGGTRNTNPVEEKHNTELSSTDAAWS